MLLTITYCLDKVIGKGCTSPFVEMKPFEIQMCLCDIIMSNKIYFSDANSVFSFLLVSKMFSLRSLSIRIINDDTVQLILFFNNDTVQFILFFNDDTVQLILLPGLLFSLQCLQDETLPEPMEQTIDSIQN